MDQRYLPAAAPAANGQPFELALVRAMIGAAKADGHIDAEEQDRIFARVHEAGLDPESKAFVFDALAAPVSVSDIAALATTPEQAAEIYLVSRLAIDPDRPAELAYLQALAHRLKLPDDLVAHLNRQIEIS
ncbi:MAG: tellurite resistance TerB family protein [Alphaproteobacteria bacterium]